MNIAPEIPSKSVHGFWIKTDVLTHWWESIRIQTESWIEMEDVDADYNF